MSGTQIDQEMMDEFFARHGYPESAGVSWRDAHQVLDDDEEAEHFDTVYEAIFGLNAVETSTCVDSEQLASSETHRIEEG